MKLSLRSQFLVAAILSGWGALAIAALRPQIHLGWVQAAAAVTLLAWFLAAVSSRRQVHSIARLIRRLKRLQTGDFHPRPAVNFGDWQLDELDRCIAGTAQMLQRIRSGADLRVAEIQGILDDLADAVIALDASGRVQRVNPSAGLFFGQIPHQQMVGRTLLECTLNHTLDEYVQPVLQSGSAVDGLLEIHSPKERSLAVTVIPRIGPEGTSVGAIVVLHDISETRNVERLRRDFVANASHELRTPVSGIQVMAESLMGGAMEDPILGPKFVRSIADSAARLASLVDDLLFLSAQESGRESELGPVDLSHLVEAVCDKMQPQAEGCGVVLTVRSSGGLSVTGDHQDLWRAVTNLVDNAIRYTDAEGRVEVRAFGSHNDVLIAVKDTGIGIPSDQQEKIFERFYRVDVARSRETGGTGLGLSIVKHIVERHKGQLTVASAAGAGSTFTIRLPRAAVQPESAASP